MADEKKEYTQDEIDALIAAKVEEATTGLKGNRDETLKEAKALKARLAAYDGVDVEEHKRLKTAAEEAEQKRLKSEGDWKALEAQLVTKYDGEITKEKEVATRYRASLEEYLVDAEAVRVLAEYSDSPTLLLPHVQKQMKVIEQDGKFVARIVDGAGNVRIGKGQGSAPMTLVELMDEMKQDKQFALAFKGSGSSGGGASKSSNGGAGGTKTIAPSDLMSNLEAVAKGEVQVQL